MKRIIVVFSGYNQRAVIAFLRALNRNMIQDYAIIASSNKDTILNSHYKDKVFYVRKNRELDKKEIFQIIKKLREKYCDKSLLLTPTTEALNRFLLEYRKEFTDCGCIIPLIKKELYEAISDKEMFFDLCQQTGFDVPRKIDFDPIFKRAYVAKPKKYFAQDGKTYSPVLVFTEEEHNAFLREYNKDDFVFQEYIEGESYYLLCYFSENGESCVFSQINYAQQPKGKSILAAESANIHREKIAEDYVEFLRRLKYFGFIMIELRKRRETYYMIEANPRLWGPSQLFADAGVPFFEMFLKDNGLIQEIPQREIRYDTKYLWSGGYEGDLLQPNACVWLGNGKGQMITYRRAYEDADIYRREDTMGIFEIEELRKLYMQVSKHSNYQILPDDLAQLLDQEQLLVKSRWESERLDFILQHVNFENKRVLDIGGNTGFFTFESIKNGAEYVDYYEGNTVHAEFVELAAKVLGVKEQVGVHPEYYLFHNRTHKYDIVLNLNVVHHLGDDFKSGEEKENAKQEMLECINSIAYCTDMMIFQMGFNWKGDSSECLFDAGLKKEMEQYIEEGTKEYWEIISTGIAVSDGERIIYEELNDENNVRIDKLGEFLNRPIFIMKSKKVK